ncbi:MAG: TonB-dependent receptor [Gammaproteobacteria bacterium]|nr:TonB-dependent receptor [Gammaproteobacteria bacterium]
MGDSTSIRISSIFGFFTLLCALAIPSQAQTVLEEIVVTAQKREQNIQDVPISITRMSGQWLESKFAGGGDVLELASTVPGLHVESSNGRLSPRFYMRGLGNADFTAAASQPVSIVFDEVPMEKASLKSFPIFDLDDIEVIRGPQGTLFGRNTTAGILKFDSRRPTEETEGYIKASGGNLGTINVEGAVGGTLVENTLMGRVSFITQHRSDWVNNAYTGENDAMGGFDIFAGRVQLLWTPSDDFSALLLYQHQDQGGNSASLFRANIFDKGSNKLNDNYDRNTVYFDGGNNNPAKIKSFGVTLKLDWDVGDHTITSITSYQDIYDRFARGDIDGGYGCLFTCGGLAPGPHGPFGPPSTPFSPFNSPFVVNVDTGGDQEVEQITQEIRIASNLDGPFNYQVGAFYFEDDLLSVSQNMSAGAPAFVVGSISEIENTTWAVFGQGSYNVSDQLTLTAGVRYTDDEKDAQHERPAVEGVLDPISLGDDELSWDVSLAFAVSDDAQVYARVATGFRAPTIQDRLEDDPVATIADSETITSYEIGYKALFDKVRLNVAGFYYEVDDMQLVAVGGDANTTTLLNADEGVGYGVEFDVDIALTDNLILSGGYGYNKTELNDKELTLPPGPLATSRDPLDENGRAIIDGNPFQHAPKWTANLQLDYTHPLANGNELYLFTDWKLKGKTSDFLYESVEFTFGTQFEGGLRLGYRDTVRNFEIGMFARNITNEHNPIGGIDFANLLGYVNQPRIWGAEARYSF